jgi:hypothetical protein
VTSSASASGVVGVDEATGGIGVLGIAPNGVGFYTADNVQQARTGGGWVKAMVNVDAFNTPYTITGCFNSTLSGAAATTPPCGINFTEKQLGLWSFDFGFQVDDRFVSATIASAILGYGGAQCIMAAPSSTFLGRCCRRN